MDEQSREEWPTPADSIKSTPSSISRFIHRPSGGKVTYICADIYDERAWQLLSGQQFNLVFSDALHSTEALDFEWRHMVSDEILAPGCLAIMWDDLDGPMRKWFNGKRDAIAAQLAVDRKQVITLYCNGWLRRESGLIVLDWPLDRRSHIPLDENRAFEFRRPRTAQNLSAQASDRADTATGALRRLGK